MRFTLLLVFLLLISTNLYTQIDSLYLLQNIRILSADSLAGRGNAQEGGEMARMFILNKLNAINPEQVSTDTFQFYNRITKKKGKGINVLFTIPGKRHREKGIVISAHYDHLGIKENEIFNGADDNASGTAGILSILNYFSANRPHHTLVFAFFDAEELGLRGANHFVDEPPLQFDTILLNINLDMVSRNENQTINVCGTNYFPDLLRPIQKIAKKRKRLVTFKHDNPKDSNVDDWTYSSDHGEFYKKGIPFLYFGVEDHPDYHQTTDDFEKIDPNFYYQTIGLITEIAEHLDQKMKKYGLSND